MNRTPVRHAAPLWLSGLTALVTTLAVTSPMPVRAADTPPPAAAKPAQANPLAPARDLIKEGRWGDAIAALQQLNDAGSAGWDNVRENHEPAKRFHLVFSLLMELMMTFLMTFVITAVNVGFGAGFLLIWAKAFVIAYLVGVPVIFFLAPVARKLTARALGVPLP